MQTVQDFALACKHLTSDEIYDLFEFDISQELRDTIYAESEIDSAEPVRDAFNKIGMRYSVQTLAEY